MRLLTTAILICITQAVWAWGNTGHRVVASIADHYLTDKAKKAVAELLGDETMVMASTWLDDIKSDRRYDNIKKLHYATIANDKSCTEREPGQKDRAGKKFHVHTESDDVVNGIEGFIKILKNKDASKEDKVFALRALIHLIGDIHQPLHVGQPGDRGGNDVMVTWMGEVSNLHRVWDSDMIHLHNMSYSEMVTNLLPGTKANVEKWQKSNVCDWATESMTYRETIYNIGKGKLGYEYSYKNFDTVELRLSQGGVRLAGVLNEIFQ